MHNIVCFEITKLSAFFPIQICFKQLPHSLKQLLLERGFIYNIDRFAVTPWNGVVFNNVWGKSDQAAPGKFF